MLLWLHRTLCVVVLLSPFPPTPLIIPDPSLRGVFNTVNMSYSRVTNGLTVTTYLPVTSYTPSSECYGYYRSDVGLGLMAFDPAYGYSVDAAVTCEPTVVTTWWLSLAPANAETIVELGPLTCPDQWSTVALSEADASSTMKMCCPS